MTKLKHLWLKAKLWFESKAITNRWALQLREENVQLAKDLSYVRAELGDTADSKSVVDAIVRERDARIGELEMKIGILEEQIKLFEVWQAREFARLEAETAIHVRHKVDALENPRNPEEFI